MERKEIRMNMLRRRLLICIVLLIFVGCATQKEIVKTKEQKENEYYYNKRDIPKYSIKQWELISKERNKELWYEEILTPEQTKFTPLWDDYSKNQYHADLLDFEKIVIDRRDDFLFAIQLGPLGPLWAYFTYIGFINADSLFEVSQSTFSHNRFTYKSRGIVKDSAELFQNFETIKQMIDSAFIDSIYYRKGPMVFKQNEMDSTIDTTDFIWNNDTLSFPVIASKKQIGCTDLSGILGYRKNGAIFKCYIPGNPIVEDTCKIIKEINAKLQKTFDSTIIWHRTY